ncbi:hypothetical protein TIFTF001_043228 [Ficus carica]|uniref:Uncharacterized protein n=1 Tax=Ficus carica TaxID=3494 RepID=A0AA87YX65_FICCA|nr:hypothetical protein TIFTF001_043228 [Ficus carica]
MKGGEALTVFPATSQMLDGMEEEATAPLTTTHGRRYGGGRDSRRKRFATRAEDPSDREEGRGAVMNSKPISIYCITGEIEVQAEQLTKHLELEWN